MVMKTATRRRGRPARTANAEPIKLAAVEGKMNADGDRIRIYTAEVPASIAAKFPASQFLGGGEGGFQRGLDVKRAEKIGRLMAGMKFEEGEPELPMPNVQGALLAYAHDEEITFDNGILTIHKLPHFFDGQHRSAGDAWAMEHGAITDYTETVKFVVGPTHAEVVRWYLTTNIEAKKIPAPNAILNVANMEGVFLNRKSWIARLVRALIFEEPFLEDDKRIVRLETGDGGMFSVFTLYKATNLMLPDELNQEGAEVEAQAVQFAHKAWSLYADLFGPAWGAIDKDGDFVDHDAYSSTMLLSFARLYRAATQAKSKNVEDVIKKAWKKAGLARGLPTHSTSSGDAAAVSLAGFLVAEAGLRPEALAA